MFSSTERPPVTLGVTADAAGTLRDALLQAAETGEAVTGRADEFGQRYVIDFEMATAVGSTTVRSAWIVGAGEDLPRLTTCYILSG